MESLPTEFDLQLRDPSLDSRSVTRATEAWEPYGARHRYEAPARRNRAPRSATGRPLCYH
jgi:hypothetical protein